MTQTNWQVGDVRVTRVLEAEAALPATGLLAQATPDALEAHAEWLKPHFLGDDGKVTLSIHALVVESAGRRIVVDTCVGERTMPGFDALSAGDNPFLDNFGQAGFDPDSIDFVLCTHMHFDHVGWNTRRDGDRFVPTFPNARYLFGRTEWEHWSAEGDSAFTGNFSECVDPIFEAGLVDLVESDHVIDENVRLESTPGHTPGHVSVRIESRGERAFITGDMTHHPVQWAEADWKMFADSDSAQAADTRRRVGAGLAQSGDLVIGTHYATPTAGYVAAVAGGLRFLTQRPDRD